jgi:hypothetical protein
MLNKIVIQTLSLIMFLSAPAYAQDTNSDMPKYTHLAEGETAPFAGTLFNPTATAQLIAEYQYSMSECDLRVEFELSRLEARHALEISNLNASANSQNERLNLLIEAKDLEIETYREMALDQPNKNNHWWLLGGTVAGIGLSLGVFFATNEIVNPE